MVAMAYDGALRREELVQIDIDDLEPAYSLIHLRAETSKSRRASEVAFDGFAKAGRAEGRLSVTACTARCPWPSEGPISRERHMSRGELPEAFRSRPATKKAQTVDRLRAGITALTAAWRPGRR